MVASRAMKTKRSVLVNAGIDGILTGFAKGIREIRRNHAVRNQRGVRRLRGTVTGKVILRSRGSAARDSDRPPGDSGGWQQMSTGVPQELRRAGRASPVPSSFGRPPLRGFQ